MLSRWIRLLFLLILGAEFEGKIHWKKVGPEIRALGRDCIAIRKYSGFSVIESFGLTRNRDLRPLGEVHHLLVVLLL